MQKIYARVISAVLCMVLILSGNFAICPAQMDVYGEVATGTYNVDSDTLPYTQEQIYQQLFDINNKIELNIDMSDEELLKLQQDYDKYFAMGSKSPIYRKADVSITIHTSKDSYTYVIQEVGVRMKGNTSRIDFYDNTNYRMYNFIHLKLDFQETFDDVKYYGEDVREWKEGAAARKARKNRTFATLEKMDTKWNRNYDTTYLREYYTYETFRNNGVIAPHVNLASVDYAGNHMGVYTIYEPVDKVFIEKYVAKQDQGGDLYKCGWADSDSGHWGSDLTRTDSIGIEDEDKCLFFCYDLKTNKKTSDHTQLKNLIQKLNSGKLTKTQLASLVDMDSFLKFAAVSYFSGNPDDFRNNYNNYYIYFLAGSGKAIFIPYDMDRCMGVTCGWNPTGDGMTGVSPFSNDAEGRGSGQTNPLFKYSVCAGGYYMKEYAEALKKVAASPWMTTTKFNTIYNIARNNYANDVQPNIQMDNADNTRFRFDNTSSASMSSDRGNLSFATFLNAIKKTCDTAIANIDQYSVQPYYLRGTMSNNWQVVESYRMSYDKASNTYSYQISTNESISFKVNNGVDANAGEWYGYESLASYPKTLNISTDDDMNIHAPAGTYTIYFQPDKKQIKIELPAQKITTKVTQIKKKYGNSAFSTSVLGAKITKGNGKLSYSTSNSKVIQYDSKSGKFKITGVGSAYIYVTASETKVYQKTRIRIPVTISQGTQKLTTSRNSYSKYYGTGTFSLQAKTTGDGKITYKSSDRKVAVVSSKGVVTMKGYGKAVITVRAAATKNCKEVSKKVTVVVKPKKQKITSAESAASKTVTVKWKKDTKAKGYQILYSTNKNLKNAGKIIITSKSTTSKKITGLKAGKTYYIKVESYVKVGKSTYHGNYSDVKKVVVK